MKKNIYLVFVVALVLIIATGCSTPTQGDVDVSQLDADTLLDEAVTSLQDANSYSIEQNISMDVVDNVNDQKVELGVKANTDIIISPEISSKTIMEMEGTLDGESKEGTVTIYVVPEDGELVTYLHDPDGFMGDAGISKQESDLASVQNIEELNDERGSFSDAKIVGKQTIDGDEVIVLECVLDVSKAMDLLDDADMLGLEESQWSILKVFISNMDGIAIKMHLDPQTHEVVMAEYDIGKTLNKAITQMLNIAAASGNEDYDISMTYVVKQYNFNGIDSIVVPEGVKNSAEVFR